MNEEIIDRLAVDGKKSCQLTAQMLAGQGGNDADEVGSGIARMAENGGVQHDGDAMRELDWAFGEASALKWHRSSAESDHSGPPPVVTVKRRRVPAPPID